MPGRTKPRAHSAEVRAGPTLERASKQRLGGLTRRDAVGSGSGAIPLLSDAEEAALQAEIANDPDNPELTDAELVRLRPAHAVLPPALYDALTRRGRPKAATKRVQLTLRVDPDVLAAYKADGPGWQTRMNAALAEGVARGKKAPERA